MGGGTHNSHHYCLYDELYKPPYTRLDGQNNATTTLVKGDGKISFEEWKAGYKLYKVKGWDYPGLCQTYLDATNYARENHTPVIIHVEEVTQPQGHSTSGSHERYKSTERL